MSAPDPADLPHPGPDFLPPAGSPPPVAPAPSPPPVPPPSPSASRPLLLVSAGLALVALVVGAAVLTHHDAPAPPPPSSPTSTPAHPGRSRPSDAARGFLEALAAGDTRTALRFVASPPPDTTLLTDAVLAASRGRAPLTAVAVPEAEDAPTGSIPVSYRLGGTTVTDLLGVVRLAGGWRVTTPVAAVTLPHVPGGLPVRVNGVPVRPDRLYLFPGSYAVTSGHPAVGYGPRATFTVLAPLRRVDTDAVRPTLTRAGRDAVVGVARQRYRRCLRRHALAPANCPFGVRAAGATVRRGSIHWRQLGSDPFRHPQVSLRGATARVTVPIDVGISATCRRGGTTRRCRGGYAGQGTALVLVTAGRLKARWY